MTCLISDSMCLQCSDCDQTRCNGNRYLRPCRALSGAPLGGGSGAPSGQRYRPRSPPPRSDHLHTHTHTQKAKHIKNGVHLEIHFNLNPLLVFNTPIAASTSQPKPCHHMETRCWEASDGSLASDLHLSQKDGERGGRREGGGVGEERKLSGLLL